MVKNSDFMDAIKSNLLCCFLLFYGGKDGHHGFVALRYLA